MQDSQKYIDKKEDNQPVLRVEHLHLTFTQYARGLRRRELESIKDLNLELKQGEILAIIGSSGSGKSLLAHAIMGILPTMQLSAEMYSSRESGSLIRSGRESGAESFSLCLSPSLILIRCLPLKSRSGSQSRGILPQRCAARR